MTLMLAAIKDRSLCFAPRDIFAHCEALAVLTRGHMEKHERPNTARSSDGQWCKIAAVTNAFPPCIHSQGVLPNGPTAQRASSEYGT